ncbi:MAG: vWA domain-containing protein [Gammaproteobacteria bacterium]
MAFQNPEAFYLLILLFPLLFILWKGRQKTIQVINAFKGEPANRFYYVTRTLLALILVTSLVMITARPYSQLKKTADFLFLVDISRSMQARKSCSQASYLDRAKLVMKSVISDIPEARFGIFVYERLTFPITQLTFDHAYLDTVIDQGIYDGLIFDRTATQLGKALSNIIQKKQTIPEQYENIEYIILLTDGNLKGDYQFKLEETIAQLVNHDIKVVPVGIGNPDPTAIPIKEEGKCVDKFIVKEDQLITIPLNSETLQFIATSTNGQYFGEGETQNLVSYLRDNALEDTFVDSGISQRQRNDISWIFMVISTLALFGYIYLDSNLRINFRK